MKTNILMVCLGNICRSPLAEGILKNKVNSNSVYIDSAGTGGYHIGNSPDPRSIAVAKKYDIDISEQKCRQFKIEDFDKFDTIYVMDLNNYNNITKLTRDQNQKEKVKLLLSETDLETKEVPDPYHDDNGFEHVYQLIDNACSTIADKLGE
ncbi:low molecular weight phosphotyrosine protein phosphatase [Cellulophaga baltica]|uniref:low molecular weight protein-tyrosine-phosphatase n=1 Tax=Cellulophaga TaxID=104264 RepID=UPI001C06B3D8|nr:MULTISPECIES: low molecular weight protein-tyrosine-phosphatase [Cellulophaga]MBU2996013.1 low molecular weight phosphotyrosine protein phosphatase [Cellulophaga baltica]MDO6767408.1 low molecular weight protein-tyrosine-phosphatase [Cellulophaga sp. 1_MG-2023]